MRSQLIKLEAARARARARASEEALLPGKKQSEKNAIVKADKVGMNIGR